MIPASKYFEELTKRLTSLKEDLVAHNADPRKIANWAALIEARYSLPEGDKVSVSYLACRFVEDYGLWSNLRHRIQKFYGDSASSGDSHTSFQIHTLATQLRETEEFQPIIGEYIDDLIRRFQRLNQTVDSKVAEVVQQVMMVDRLCAIRSGNRTGSYVEKLRLDGRCAMARKELAATWSNRDSGSKSLVGRRLGAYRRNMLMARNLEAEDTVTSPVYLPLEMMSGGRMAKLMNNPFDDDELGTGLWEKQIGPMVSTLEDYFESWGGFAEAYDILTDDYGGDQSRGFGGPITVIPSRSSTGVCNPVCLVLAKVGAKRNAAKQFDDLMKTLWAYLTRCPIATSIVIVTDWWDAKLFTDQHFEMFKAFHDTGRRFVFLSVGCPDTGLAPIAVDLS